ncbi:MAG: zinc ABC transporter substrate-binding protein [Bacteroidetes bacterium]|nr:zinc ABC transporter substrate-binding protein [Bacteroidota bacterium]
MQAIKYCLISVQLLMVLNGCSSDKPVEISEKIEIAVSFSTYKNFVNEVGGDKVDVISMLPSGISPPEFDPIPSSLMKLAGAKYYLGVGDFFEFEKIWIEKLKGVNPSVKVYDTSKDLEELDHNHHVWNGTDEVKIITRNIKNILCAVDSSNKTYYEENYKSYIEKLDSVDQFVKKQFASLKHRTILTYHPAWLYYAETYGLEQLSVEDHGREPNTKDLMELIIKARQLKLKAVFIQPQFSSNTAEVIARDINAELVVIDPLPDNFIENLIDITNKIMRYAP